MASLFRIFLLVCSGTFCSLKSQILNIDREVNDSMTKKWYGLISGSFTKDKQKVDIQDLSIYTEAVYKLKNGQAITYVGQIDATISGNDLLQNEGFFQCRRRDLDRKKNSIEYYLQHQWNGAWGMISRYLVGFNFRKRILELNGYDLYFGIGTFYQTELWNYNGVADLSKIPVNPSNIKDLQLRTNSYIKGAIKLTPKCDFVCQSYFQTNALSTFTNPSFRWYWSSEIVYNVTNNWMLGFNYDHTFNQNNPVPINKFYYGYTGNLSLKF
jgi:hypothetical protein